MQQQAASQESIQNAQFNRLQPTLDGLAENKLTQRDVNYAFGLFSPFRHKIQHYPDKDGYNILSYGDHLRFLEIMASRSGGGNVITPLLFHGAVNWFEESKGPNAASDLAIIKYYNHTLKQKQND